MTKTRRNTMVQKYAFFTTVLRVSAAGDGGVSAV
jgi:hypothetical protein